MLLRFLMIFAIRLFLFLLSFSAQATNESGEFKCHLIFKESLIEKSVQVQINARVAHIYSEVEIKELILKSKKHFQRHLQFPSDLQIELDRGYLFSHYNSESNYIFFGIHQQTGLKLHSDSNYGVLLHEVGHSVFEYNLRIKNPDYKLEAASKLDQEIILAYHELFADLFAIVIQNDYKAISKVSTYFNIKPNEIAQRFKKFELDITKSEPLSSLETYSVFSRFKYNFWKIFRKEISESSETQKVIPLLFEILQDQMMIDLKSSDGSSVRERLKKAELSLVYRIDKNHLINK